MSYMQEKDESGSAIETCPSFSAPTTMYLKNKWTLTKKKGTTSEVLCLNGTWPSPECISLYSTFTELNLTDTPCPNPSNKQ